MDPISLTLNRIHRMLTVGSPDGSTHLRLPPPSS
jgi:hypothetical protein